jgi:hypothetical protein
MDFFDKITGNRSSGWHTRPWRSRLPGGVYLTRKREAWVYSSIPLTSLEWEDAPKRLTDQQRLERLIVELGESTKDIGQGTAMLAQTRSVHIVSMLVDVPAVPDVTISPALAALHAQLLPTSTTNKHVFVGVKLRRDALSALTSSENDDAASSRMKQAMKSMRSDDIASYRNDMEKVTSVLSRAGGQEPTDEQLNWLESWFNDGQGVDVALAASDMRLRRPNSTGWQISALMGVDDRDMWLSAPDAPWALDAMNHPDGADVISLRAELQPATVTRARLRRSQRIIAAQEEEEDATGDVTRDELGERRHKAKDVENYTRSAGHAWLTNLSVLFARRLGPPGQRLPDETFADEIAGSYGMAVKPLEKRQLQALAEMLPGESPVVNPFPQDVNPAWVAYSGLTGFGAVGDETGLVLGEAAPHFTTTLIDYLAAAKKNKGPAMCMFGRPGSGKASWVGANVLTPRGWVKMGEVKAGDVITGRDGNAQRVEAVHPQGVVDLFEVTFSDGAHTTVSGDHLWTVSHDNAQHPRWTTVHTRALVTDDASIRWKVPLVDAVHYHVSRSKKSDPYVAGVRVACATSLTSEVDSLRHARPHVRTEFVAGAVAAARLTGSAREFGCEQVAGFVVELIRSIGGVASWQGTMVTHMAWPGRGTPIRYVTDVREVAPGHAQCISVSNEDSLYVTDDFIVTHNTFAAQFVAGQAALNGTASILINPKGHDSLAPFAHWVSRSGGQAQIVSLSKLEEEGGAFDPFRFCDPRMAAEVLDRHIVSVLGQSVNGGMSGRQETELSRGLAEGADKGARCAADALAYVRDEDVTAQVLAMAESNSLFRLGFGFTPQQAWGTTGGFTLIEFDREMAWPTAGKNPGEYDRPERVAVAALRLVSRASLEILMRAGGGILVVDEAHHFLASAEGRATVDRINREGRSLKLLPIFCTQRVTDLVNDSAVDMETFISRVLVLNLPDAQQSKAALTLCGLEPTDQRMSYLRTSPSGWGFFRDVDDRHSVVHVGAGISPEMHQSMSTNYTDRKNRSDADATGA